MPEELPLEPDLIKVLAADTRREILSLLRDRRMTVTELSRELDLGKATVHEHLDKLTEADLVERQEDDRLWVYYRLTGRGKRLLNPQRTRFYLALASALVAALVAGLAVYGFLAVGGAGGPTMEETAAGFDRAVVPTEREIYADDEIEIPARVQGEGDVEAYLVDEDSASRIRQGDLNVRGLPMRASSTGDPTGEVQARDNATLLRADASLEPGTYYLYVRGEDGDNAASMPSLRLVGLEADAERTTWYRGLDAGPLAIEVTRDGDPAEGRLRLTGPPEAGASPVVPLQDGRARLSAETLDELALGEHRVSVRPADASRWIDLPTTVTVAQAPLAPSPLHVPEGSSSVQIHLEGPQRLHELEPSLQGANGTVEPAEAGWRVDLADARPGTVQLELARTSTPVQVHPRIALEAEVRDGPEVHWTVRTLGGAPVADAAVYLDGRPRGFTDANGTLVTELPAEGDHRLGVHRSDGLVLTRAFTVDGWRIEQASPRVSVEPVDVASGEGSATLTVAVANDGTLGRAVTLIAEVAGTPAATAGLEVPANATRQTTLTVPVDPGRQAVTVDAHPLDDGPFTYANETTSSDDGNETREETEADATDADATGGGASEATVELPSADREMDGAQEAVGSKLEPVSPTGDAVADGEAGAAEESAESPPPGAIVTLGALAVTAFVAARARKA